MRLRPVPIAVALLLALSPPASAREPGRDVAQLEAELTRTETELGPDDPACAPLHDALRAAATERGELTKALHHAERAVEIRAAHLPPSHPDVAASLQEAGYAHYRLEDWGAAVSVLREALGAWIANPATAVSDVVWCESDLAEMLRLDGRFAESEAALRSALQRARAGADAAAYVPVLVNNLGTLLWDQDRLDEAEPLLRESLDARLAEEPPAPLRIATARLNLGVLLRSQADLAGAEEQLAAALRLVREHGEPAQRIHFLNGLAGVYARTSRFEEAFALREESLGILAERETPAHVLEADILHALATDRLAHGEPDAAERRFEEARRLRERTLGPDHPSVGASLVGVARARAEREGDADPSLEPLLDRALGTLRDSPVATGDRARALILRARHLRATGRAEPAVTALHDALAIADTLRATRGGGEESRLALASEFRRASCRLVDWLVEDGRIADAFREAERIKARVLRDEMGATGVNLRAGIPSDVLEPLERDETAATVRVRELRRAMRYGAASADGRERSRQTHELDAAVLRLRDVTDRIKLHSPGWKRILRETGAEVTVDAVRRSALAPGEALLAYQVGPERSWAFVVPAGDGPVRAHELPGLAEASLARRLEGSRGLGSLHAPRGPVRGVSGVRPLATGEPGLLRALGTLLLPAAVRADITGATGVVVVPDGRLHAVPFEALEVGSSDDAPEYWLDRGPPIRYAHSAVTLLTAPGDSAGRAAPTAGPVVSSFADPAFGDGSTFPRLPGTAREADALERAFGPERVRRFRGPDATEAAFRREAAAGRWLHVATHAVVDPARSDWSSALVLAAEPASPHDGFLHLHELLGLPLDCRLAVLSACDTNAGRLVEGEGVFALSRAFLVAGAEQVVASLWPLHDEAAAELTASLFTALGVYAAKDGARLPAPETARLLRDAKRGLRASDRFGAPHYWAPFVLTVTGTSR